MFAHLFEKILSDKLLIKLCRVSLPIQADSHQTYSKIPAGSVWSGCCQ